MNAFRTLAYSLVFASVVTMLGAPACTFGHNRVKAAEPLPPPPPPPPPPAPGVMDLDTGVQTLLKDLAGQLGPTGAGSRTLAVDPLLDGKTGQQTVGTQRTHQLVIDKTPTLLTQAKLVPFDAAGAALAQLIATGTLSQLPEKGRFKLTLAISDRASGIVVAQSAVQIKQDDLSTAPTRFYGDSPSLVRDRSTDGYIRTAETERGKAADTLYIEQLPTAALLSTALEAYNAEHWEQALTYYNEAVKRTDGQQLKTFNGIYLANVRLNRLKEAETAFGKIAALGLATNNLAVKLLFTPGTTDFWADGSVSSVYPMWLRQIARAANSANSCLSVVGHTSKSGTVEVNDKLSLERASVIRTRLNQEVKGISARVGVRGVGSRENLIGTGADDVTDALDRRVEFKVVDCNAPREGAPVGATPAATTATAAPGSTPTTALPAKPAAVQASPTPPATAQPAAATKATPATPTATATPATPATPTKAQPSRQLTPAQTAQPAKPVQTPRPAQIVQ